MDDNGINILLIEDNPGDARLIDLMLAEPTALACRLQWRDDLTSGLACLNSQPIDLLLLDLGLPECSGLATLRAVQAQVSKLPALVVLSGLSDEDVALRAVQAGAQDYLVKGRVDSALLVRAIRYAIERSRAEEALRQAHAHLESRVQERTAELAGAVAALKCEIAERELAEAHIRYMAHYDGLTGLPNRALFQDRLTQAIAHAHRKQSQVAVLLLDLDYFKHINDSLGHQMGDRLLQAVAGRLQQCLREGDSVARLGGDEFVLCLTALPGSIDAAAVAKKVQETLHPSFVIEGNQLHVSASIGISLYPDDGKTTEALMSAADTAMYRAKDIGRRNYQFFTPALNRAVQERIEQEQQLRLALLHDELELYYQPQVDLESGRIVSAEALLRWHPPGKNAISCGTFIAVAEETGLILPLGEWTLAQACQQLKRWQDAGHSAMRVAVNLSPRQFYQDDFQRNIEDIIAASGVAPGSVELEITEGILLQRNEDNLAKLHQLSDMGIGLSVDDFGTGYSSLAYLQRFPVDGLKIDQSFVRAINEDRGATALVTAIISMARSLNLKVLAEGVETEEQIRFLRSHGCRYGQGFFYSQAVPGDELQQFLSGQGRWPTCP